MTKWDRMGGLQLFCTHPVLTGPAAIPTEVHILRPKNLGGTVERERGTHFGTSFAPALHGETSQIKVDRLGSMRVGFNTVDVFSDSLILSTCFFFVHTFLPLQFLHPLDKQLAQASNFSTQHTWDGDIKVKIHDVDFAQILVGLRPEDVTSLWSRRSVVRMSWDIFDMKMFDHLAHVLSFQFQRWARVVSDFHLWPFNFEDSYHPPTSKIAMPNLQHSGESCACVTTIFRSAMGLPENRLPSCLAASLLRAGDWKSFSSGHLWKLYAAWSGSLGLWMDYWLHMLIIFHDFCG